MRESSDLAPINLDELRGLKIEKKGKIIFMIMNTDDMLIAYSDDARDLVDSCEKKLNNSFEATPILRLNIICVCTYFTIRTKGILTLDARRHVYGLIIHMPVGLDPNSDVGVSTPLDPHEVYSKAHSPPEIDFKFRDKVWQVHGKLIHLAIWARPDLVHFVSVLGRYVHNPSEKLWRTYSRIAIYLVRLETSSSFSEPHTSNLWISNPRATLTPIGADLLMIENLQASISSSCSAQQSAGK